MSTHLQKNGVTMEQFKNTNIISAIGDTPIIRLQKIDKDIESELYVKLEY